MAQGIPDRKRRPTGWLLLLYRLPVWVYRLRLGWLLSRPLLGFWFLMITHRGRRTGKTYHTVVEIIRYDQATNEYIIVSGYGEESDWYRNLRATPALRIQIGNHRYAIEQRFLTPEQVYLEFVGYERRHSQAARTLPRHLGLPYDGSEAQRRAVAAALRMVAFHPTDEAGSPGWRHSLMPVLFDKAVKLSLFDKLTTNGFNKLIFQQVGARHTVPLPTEAFPRTPTPLFYLGYNI